MSADDHGRADSAVISLAAGARVAGYRLEERVGQGGTAVVFRAHDERLGRPVALKILAPALAGDEESRRRFLSESRAAAAVDDPHIVPVYGADEADGVLFIAMRYIAGGDARSLLKREGPLPPERAAAIVSPVASALDAAHRAGLVHRDVKPSNMLLDVLPGRPAHVYLSDFGLSKPVAATSGVTAAGSIRGTLAYASPEQVRSEPVDGRADQYALACTACELLTGAPPFQRDDPAALMYAHLSEAPPPLTARRPGLPPAADAVIAKALAKVPGDRYDTCGDFADALRHALGLPPYRSGAQVMPATQRPVTGAEEHPPTEDAWPEPREDAQRGGPGAGGVTVPPAAPGTPRAVQGSEPVTDGATGPNAAAAPGVQRLDASRNQARLRRRLRRRIAVVAGIVAAAGLALGLLLVPGQPAAPALIATVPIAVKSPLSPVNGDVYVVYQGINGEANAEVSGKVAGAANGEVAKLYAQSFPYKSQPSAVASLALRPARGTAAYAFKVTPTLTTQYRVELFRSSTAATPLAMSAFKTVYVTGGEVSNDTQNCDGSVCYVALTTVFSAPPSALKTEMAKTLYLYAGISLSKPHTKAPPPKWLYLGTGHGTVLDTDQISADEFTVTASFSFTVGADSDDVGVAVCAKDSLAIDGLGLPGHHGCGDQRIPYPAGYLG